MKKTFNEKLITTTLLLIIVLSFVGVFSAVDNMVSMWIHIGIAFVAGAFFFAGGNSKDITLRQVGDLKPGVMITTDEERDDPVVSKVMTRDKKTHYLLTADRLIGTYVKADKGTLEKLENTYPFDQ